MHTAFFCRLWLELFAVDLNIFKYFYFFLDFMEVWRVVLVWACL